MGPIVMTAWRRENAYKILKTCSRIAPGVADSALEKEVIFVLFLYTIQIAFSMPMTTLSGSSELLLVILQWTGYNTMETKEKKNKSGYYYMSSRVSPSLLMTL